MTSLTELASRRQNPAPPCLLTSASTSRVTAREGEDAILVVTKGPASGPIIHMSWTKGSKQLIGERYRFGENNNTVQLTLEAITRDDEGEYTVTAKNIAGESQSAVQLRIKDNDEEDDTPIFLRKLNDLSVKVGTRTRFLVEIRSSSGVKAMWYRNDVPISEGERFNFLHEGNFFCIDVAPVTVEDNGRWACVAENQAGRSSCSCRLNVLIPKAYKAPEFLEELKAILTNQGTVSLECKVVGVPTPVLKWYKDGKEIKAGDVFALTANPDDPTSLGTYTCEAVNCMGKSYSSSRVHVMGKGSREGSLKPADYPPPVGPSPHFATELKDEKVKIGSRLVLSCQVVVPPWPRTIQWYNKEGKVESSDKYHIMEDGIGGYSIEIFPVEATDEGEWKCVATNNAGVMGITTCTVYMSYPKNYRKPKFLESLKAILTEEGLVSFECKVVGFPTPQLRWFKDGQELRPGDVYQLSGTNSLGSYSCIAKNCMGEAQSTAELTVEDIQGQLDDEEKLMLFSKNQPPRFIKGLKSFEAKINEDFRFTVKVTIVPEPNLTWYKDNKIIEKSEKFNITRENLGVYHLDVRKLDLTDQTEWKCVATNDFGQSVTSSFLKLIIPKHYKKPRFLECLRAILTQEGSVNLECKVIGVPQPTLKWYKDGKELNPGDIHKIVSGQDGTCCLGTYTCEAQNCMGSVSSSASLLGFDDRMAIKDTKCRPELEYNLAKNTSLSTINEERTSQLYDTPLSEHSVTMDDRGDVSFSFDGREVSISLYETPDLTEDDALQVVEMYAEELSEHVSEQNIVELPPLRFTKESSKSGNLLMEAVVIDITPEYFSSAEDDLRTEADLEDVSMADEASRLFSPPPEDLNASEKINSQFIQKSLTNLEGAKEKFKKISHDKSSGSDIDSYKSFSDSKQDDKFFLNANEMLQANQKEHKKDSKKDENGLTRSKTSRSRSPPTDKSKSFEENYKDDVVSIIPKRKSRSRSDSTESSEESWRKKPRSASDPPNIGTAAEDVQTTLKPLEKNEDLIKQSVKRQSRSSMESPENSFKKKKSSHSKSPSLEKEQSIPKPPARKKKLGSLLQDSGNKMEDEIPTSEKEKVSRDACKKRSSRSTSPPSSQEDSLKTDQKHENTANKKKKTRSRSASSDKLQKLKTGRNVVDEVEKTKMQPGEGEVSDRKGKGSLIILKNVSILIQELLEGFAATEQEIKIKCLETSQNFDYELFESSIKQIKKELKKVGEEVNSEDIPSVETLQSIDRPLQDLKTGLKLLDEKKQNMDITDTLEIFRLVLNHLRDQIIDATESKEPEIQRSAEVLIGLAEPIETTIGLTDKLKIDLTNMVPGDTSQLSVELLRIMAQPVQRLKQAVESIRDVDTVTPLFLSEPVQNLTSSFELIRRHAPKELDRPQASTKIISRLNGVITEIDQIMATAKKVGQEDWKEVGEALSEPVQRLHRELVKLVQETLFSPSKSKSPVDGESFPIIKNLSKLITQILNNLRGTEDEKLPQTMRQKRELFLMIIEPLKNFKAAIDQSQLFEEDEEAYSETVTDRLRNLDSSLSSVETNLRTLPKKDQMEINPENLIQTIRDIRKEITSILRFVEFGGESSAEVWNALLAPLQKLNVNLSMKRIGEKSLHLMKSGSSLGKSLEMIRQTSEEQASVEVSASEKPRMSLAALRPLEKPLQDLEEGFELLIKHILGKEQLTDEEKPVIESRIRGLLEILSQPFETFQEKWVNTENNKPSDVTMQEANVLLELVKDLSDGANAIQLHMNEFETVSPATSEAIRKNIHSNLKNLKGSIDEVENNIRKESLEAIPQFIALKSTVKSLLNEMATFEKEAERPEEAETSKAISFGLSNLPINLEKIKWEFLTTERHILDEITSKSFEQLQEQLAAITINKVPQVKEQAQVTPLQAKVLCKAKELLASIQTEGEDVTVEKLSHVIPALERFKNSIKDLTAENPRTVNVDETLRFVQTNLENVTREKPLEARVKEAMISTFENLQTQLQDASSGQRANDGILKSLSEIQEILNEHSQKSKVVVFSILKAPLEDVKNEIEKTPEGGKCSATCEKVLEQIQRVCTTLLDIFRSFQNEQNESGTKTDDAGNSLKRVIGSIQSKLCLTDEKFTDISSNLYSPLQCLRSKLEEIENIEDEEKSLSILKNFTEHMKDLDENLGIVQSSPQIEESVSKAMISAFTTILEDVTDVAEKLGSQTKGSTALQTLAEPLEQISEGILRALPPERSTRAARRSADIINLIESDIKSIERVEFLNKKAKDDLIKPLKELRAEFMEIATETKSDEVSHVVRELEKPLGDLEKSFRTARATEKTETLVPFSEISQSVAEIQKQLEMTKAQIVPEDNNFLTLKTIIDPISNLQVGLANIIQDGKSIQTLETLTDAEKIINTIDSIEKNVTTLGECHDVKKVLVPLEFLKAEIVETAPLSGTKIGNVLESVHKTMTSLQKHFETTQSIQTTLPQMISELSVEGVQNELQAIQGLITEEAVQGECRETEILMKLSQHLRSLETGLADAFQPLKEFQNLKKDSNPNIVTDIIRKTVKSVSDNQILTVEVKKDLTNTMNELAGKLSQAHERVPTNEYIDTIYDKVIDLLEELQKGVEIVECTDELGAVLRPIVKGLACPIREMRKEIVDFSDETAIANSSKAKGEAEQSHESVTIVQSLERFQTDLENILKSIGEANTHFEPGSAVLLQVTNVVDENLESLESLKTLDESKKIEESLKELKLRLENLRPTALTEETENVINLGIIQPMKNLKEKLAAMNELNESPIELVMPMEEFQAGVVAVREQIILEQTERGTASEESAKVLEALLPPLEELVLKKIKFPRYDSFQIDLLKSPDTTETTIKTQSLELPEKYATTQVIKELEDNIVTVHQLKALESVDRAQLTETLTLVHATLQEATNPKIINATLSKEKPILKYADAELDEGMQSQIGELSTEPGLTAAAASIQYLGKQIDILEGKAAVNRPTSLEVLKEVVEPLRELHAKLEEISSNTENLTEFRPPRVRSENVSEIVHVVERSIALIENKHGLSLAHKEKLVEPLKKFQAKMEMLEEEGLENPPNTIEAIVKPLTGLENQLEDLNQEESGDVTENQILESLASPLSEIQRGINFVRKQEITMNEDECNKKFCQDLLQPLQQFYEIVTEFIQPIEKISDAEEPVSCTTKNLIHIIDRNLAVIEKNEVVNAELRNAVEHPLKELKVKITERLENDTTDMPLATKLIKPLSDLAENLANTKSQALPPAETAAVVSLKEVGDELETAISGLTGPEAVDSLSLKETLYKLHVGVLQMVDASEIPLQIPDAPKPIILQNVIHAVQKNLACIDRQDTLNAEVKLNIVKSLNEIHKATESFTPGETIENVKVLENLVSPLEILHKGLERILTENMQETQNIQTRETPIKEFERAMATVQEQVSCSNEKVVQDLSQPLQHLQSATFEILSWEEACKEMNQPEVAEEYELCDNKEKVKEAIHLVERSVAHLDKVEVIEDVEYLTKSLENLKANLARVAEMEKPDEKSVNVLECLIKPLNMLEQSLRFETAHKTMDRPATAVSIQAIPIAEIQKEIAEVRKETIFELEEQIPTPERENILKQFVEPLKQLQEGLMHMSTLRESSREMKESYSPVQPNKIISFIKVNMNTINGMEALKAEKKDALMRPLKFLEEAVNQFIEDNKNAAVVLETLEKPLNELEKELREVERISVKTTKFLEETELPMTATIIQDINKDIAKLKEEITIEIDKTKKDDVNKKELECLEKLIHPLENLRISLPGICMTELEEAVASLPPNGQEALTNSKILSEVVSVIDADVAAVKEENIFNKAVAQALDNSLKELRITLTQCESAKPHENFDDVLEKLIDPLRELHRGIKASEKLSDDAAVNYDEFKAPSALTLSLIRTEKSLAAVEEHISSATEEQNAGKEEEKEFLKSILKPIHRIRDQLGKMVKPESKVATVQLLTDLVRGNIQLITDMEYLGENTLSPIIEPLQLLQEALDESIGSKASKEAELILEENLMHPMNGLKEELRTMIREKAGEKITELSSIEDLKNGASDILKSGCSAEKVFELIAPPLARLKEGLDNIFKVKEELEKGEISVGRDFTKIFSETEGTLKELEESISLSQKPSLQTLQKLGEELNNFEKKKDFRIITNIFAQVQNEIDNQMPYFSPAQKNLIDHLKVEISMLEQNLNSIDFKTILPSTNKERIRTTLETLHKAAINLHTELENPNVYMEWQSIELTNMKKPLLKLESALEKIVKEEVIEPQKRDRTAEVSVCLKDLSQSLNDITKQINTEKIKEKNTLSLLIEPLSSIITSVDNLEKNSFPCRNIQNLPDSDLSILEAIANGMSELKNAITKLNGQEIGEVIEIENAAKNGAQIKSQILKPPEALTTESDMQEFINEYQNNESSKNADTPQSQEKKIPENENIEITSNNTVENNETRRNSNTPRKQELEVKEKNKNEKTNLELKGKEELKTEVEQEKKEIENVKSEEEKKKTQEGERKIKDEKWEINEKEKMKEEKEKNKEGEKKNKQEELKTEEQKRHKDEKEKKKEEENKIKEEERKMKEEEEKKMKQEKLKIEGQKRQQKEEKKMKEKEKKTKEEEEKKKKEEKEKIKVEKLKMEEQKRQQEEEEKKMKEEKKKKMKQEELIMEEQKRQKEDEEKKTNEKEKNMKEEEKKKVEEDEKKKMKEKELKLKEQKKQEEEQNKIKVEEEKKTKEEEEKKKKEEKEKKRKEEELKIKEQKEEEREKKMKEEEEKKMKTEKLKIEEQKKQQEEEEKEKKRKEEEEEKEKKEEERMKMEKLKMEEQRRQQEEEKKKMKEEKEKKRNEEEKEKKEEEKMKVQKLKMEEQRRQQEEEKKMKEEEEKKMKEEKEKKRNEEEKKKKEEKMKVEKLKMEEQKRQQEEEKKMKEEEEKKMKEEKEKKRNEEEKEKKEEERMKMEKLKMEEQRRQQEEEKKMKEEEEKKMKEEKEKKRNEEEKKKKEEEKMKEEKEKKRNEEEKEKKEERMKVEKLKMEEQKKRQEEEEKKRKMKKGDEKKEIEEEEKKKKEEEEKKEMNEKEESKRKAEGKKMKEEDKKEKLKFEKEEKGKGQGELKSHNEEKKEEVKLMLREENVKNKDNENKKEENLKLDEEKKMKRENLKLQEGKKKEDEKQELVEGRRKETDENVNEEGKLISETMRNRSEDKLQFEWDKKDSTKNLRLAEDIEKEKILSSEDIKMNEETKLVKQETTKNEWEECKSQKGAENRLKDYQLGDGGKENYKIKNAVENATQKKNLRDEMLLLTQRREPFTREYEEVLSKKTYASDTTQKSSCAQDRRKYDFSAKKDILSDVYDRRQNYTVGGYFYDDYQGKSTLEERSFMNIKGASKGGSHFDATQGAAGKLKKPSILIPLKSQAVSEGNTVKFSCTLLSDSETSIQWLKDGMPVFVTMSDHTSGKFRCTDSDGVATLIIANVACSDTGEYTCLAQNRYGEVSTTSTLRVYGGFEPAPMPPIFTKPIKETYKFSEDELTLECRVRSQPSSKVTWLKNGAPIKATSRYQVTQKQDGLCVLTIYHPEPDDSGEYRCKAENDVAAACYSHYVSFNGRQRHSADRKFNETDGRRLREYDKPRFHLGLTENKVEVGGTIALQVQLKGTPREVKWLRNAEELPKASSRIRSFEDSGMYTLLVSDASEKEAGVYTCRAYGHHSHVDTSAALHVLPVGTARGGKPPKIINKPPSMMTITVEDDIILTCRVTGDPRAKVTWLKGLKDITVTERTMVEHNDDYYKFTLKKAVPADAGTYWIVAKNTHGSDSAFVTVQVRQRTRSLTPGPFSSNRWNWGSTQSNSPHETSRPVIYKPKETPGPISSEPFVTDSGRNWISLSWEKPCNRGAGPVIAYRVDIWQTGEGGGAQWSELGVSPVNTFDVFNLKSGVDYKFRITPRNRYGWGEPFVTSAPIAVGNAITNLPEFTKILPGQLKALLGSEITLECQIQSDALPTITWYRDSLPIDFESQSRFSSKFDKSKCQLRIEDLRETDSGRYMCEAVNRKGRVSTFARLLVVSDRKIWEADTQLKRKMLDEQTTENFPPQFTMRLRDRRVQMTYPVRLTCQVIGTPKPEINWFRNGNHLNEDERHSFTNEDHFCTLEISKTILDDSGCYTATAKNEHGSVSCNCNLVVDKGIRAYVAPLFTTELPESRTFKCGEELRLSAQVEAYPSVGVVWHRNGIRLRPSRRIIMTLSHNGTIELAIASITEKDSATYTCTAANEVGRSETSCKVIAASETSPSSVPQIHEPSLPYSKAPIFITKPRSSEAAESDTVIIDCEVVGDPKPEVFWLRDFLKPEYYRDSPHFRRQGEGPKYRLEIPNAKIDYTGTYSVVARNVHGEAKAVISLQIYAKGQGKEDKMDHGTVTHGNVETLPVFKKGLKDIRCCDGDAVTLECVVSAAEPVEIRWEKDGKLVPLENDFSTNFDGTTASLTIKQVYPEDEGEYTCIAYNEVGRTSTSACLVVDVPEEKENLLSRQLSRPTGIMSGTSTPRSTPRTTPSRSISPYPSNWKDHAPTPIKHKRLKVASPKFYAVPHNRIAEEGETVRFQCAVSGHPTPWVTWDKNNTVVTPSARITFLEKEDLKVLQIEEVTIEDAGLYRVIVENEVGRIEATARLDVIGPRNYKAKTQNIRSWSASPTFRRRLTGSLGRVGGNVTLACDVRFSPNPVTSWYRNGELIVRTRRITPTWDGVTAMLQIEQLELDDAGIYTCVAENEIGKCYCSAELTVIDGEDENSLEIDTMPPVFIETPEDVTVEEGNPTELTVKIKGCTPLDVVWVKDNKEIPNCEDFRYVDYEDGRFGLRIADVFLEDTGKYLCEVFNQYGEAVSCVNLSVKESVRNQLPKIEFSKKPSSVGITKGKPVSFCSRFQHVPSDFDSVLVQWKVGNNIVDSTTVSTKYSVEQNDDISILHISSAEQCDSGIITCTARHTCSLCTTKSLRPDECSCSQTANTCTAELTVFPGNETEGRDGECRAETLKKNRSRSLSTGDIEITDSKMFKNWQNQANRNKTNCLDKSRAVITEGPSDVTVLKDEKVVLRAEYDGQPEPEIRWLKGGRILQNTEKINIITGGGTTSLFLNCITADDSGKYVVCVENDLGADCHFASVAVKGPPDSPSSYPLVTNLGHNAVEIEWSSPAFDGGSKITGYIVEMKNPSDGEWKKISGLCHSLSYVATNLQENAKYKFRVRAENIHGQSEPGYESNEITVMSNDTDFEFKNKMVAIQPGALFKESYEVLEELGKGRFGTVHKVAHTETGQKFAAKFIRCIKVKDREKVKEEIEIMNILSHPKLLKLAAAFENPRDVVMVMEYISGGELFERVVADDFQLTERDCILFIKQICEGVEYMHNNSIVHLDLKPENIMCRSRTSHDIKIIDFGLAKKLDVKNPVRVLFGTPEFAPPEVISYEPIGFESDMWSIGVICYVLLSGLSPFMGENDAETFANITRSTFDFDDEAFDAISEDAKDFISSLLVKRKEKRLTASQCLKNKWMNAEPDEAVSVILSTDKLKKFIIRRKWQKTANAIRALGRMASLSAATRKNTEHLHSTKQETFLEEESKKIREVNECENNSSPSKSWLSKRALENVKSEDNSMAVKKAEGEKDELKACSERSDSGISDCSSVGSNHNNQHGPLNSLQDKKFSITEEEENHFQIESTAKELCSKVTKEETGKKVDIICKKFANLSKSIDEMDLKLETVGKKLECLAIAHPVMKKSEIEWIPNLKELKNPETVKTRLMQHTVSSQAKISVKAPQQYKGGCFSNETSMTSVSNLTNLKTHSHTDSSPVKANKLNSVSLPTANGQLFQDVKTGSEMKGSDSRTKTQPSIKFQKLQEMYRSKVIATVQNGNSKSEITKLDENKTVKNKNANSKSLYGVHSTNFQETVAFWNR